jgi:DegV family protein with EDD domain
LGYQESNVVAVKIVTDSTSGLTPEIASELGITVVPMYVHFGTESYRDGIDLTTEEFYQRLMHSKTLPVTAGPGPATFAEVYDRLAEETDEILVITLSSKLSVIYEVELQGVELMKRRCRVEVVDSLWGIMAQGLIAIAAAKAANAGANLDQVVDVTRENIRRTDLRIAFDTLEYLRRGGRIGIARAFLGSMLKVNPILTLKNGKAHPVARKRSRSKAIDYLYDFVMGYSNIEEMAIEDATTPDEAEMLAERLSSKFPKERIYRAKVSPAVGTHVGPRVLAVSVLGDRR